MSGYIYTICTKSNIKTKVNFTEIMIPQKVHQPMQYWSKKMRKMWHDQNSGKWIN